MKQSVFIFHGTGGHPGENWFPWLKKELEKRNYSVYIPQFPSPSKPQLAPWLSTLEDYSPYITDHSILIGHSLGGLFLLRLLEQLKKPVKSAIFVAASAGIKPIKFYQGDYEFSHGFSFQWEKIKSNATNFIVYHSDNDPYISLENGKKIAKELGVDLSYIPQAGHINSESGFTTFNLLLQNILSIP